MPDYHRTSYQAYHSRTVHLDPECILRPLTETVPADASLLDAGCGSGYDLHWLKRRGYRLMGLERVSERAATIKALTWRAYLLERTAAS